MIAPASPASVARAAALLRAGTPVAFPTETVYGLGADATSDAAVARVFEIKGRPAFNPLIVHVDGLGAAEALAELDDAARALARAFWPGPLSLVVPRRRGCPVSPLACAGLGTVAVRAPRHGTAQAILAAAGVPVAAPSANPSGKVSPTRAEHVAESLGDAVPLVIDAGPCPVGIESTVVACAGGRPAILRPGGVTAEEIAAAVGGVGAAGAADVVASPGMLERHYAPGRPLRLDAEQAAPGEALLAFGPASSGAAALNLSPAGDLREAAANLFAMLRALDQAGHAAIAVAPIPDAGLGRAINDRLRRAAAGAPDGNG